MRRVSTHHDDSERNGVYLFVPEVGMAGVPRQHLRGDLKAEVQGKHEHEHDIGDEGGGGGRWW